MSGIPAGPFGLTVLATAAALLVTMAVTFAVALRVGKHSVADTAWGLGIALVLDNYATHKTPAIHQWLLKHPHFHLHSTPASSSWLNLVDRWFAELTSRKLRRSARRSVTELEDDIRKWINEWNKNPQSFVWTKSADDILETLAAYC